MHGEHRGASPSHIYVLNVTRKSPKGITKRGGIRLNLENCPAEVSRPRGSSRIQDKAMATARCAQHVRWPASITGAGPVGSIQEMLDRGRLRSTGACRTVIDAHL